MAANTRFRNFFSINLPHSSALSTSSCHRRHLEHHRAVWSSLGHRNFVLHRRRRCCHLHAAENFPFSDSSCSPRSSALAVNSSHHQSDPSPPWSQAYEFQLKTKFRLSRALISVNKLKSIGAAMCARSTRRWWMRMIEAKVDNWSEDKKKSNSSQLR